MKKKLAVIILAAGKGKRLGGKSQKVVKKLLGRPMLIYLLDTLELLYPEKIVLIVGHKKEEVFEELRERKVEYAQQQVPRGTGDAVIKASGVMADYRGDVLILCGDVPFITADTLKNLVKEHAASDNSSTILTFNVDNPTGYGRIKRNGSGTVKSIVEELSATEEERRIGEVNSGIYVFDKEELFTALNKVQPDPVKGEYYLTDVIEILSREGKRIGTCTTGKPEECMGINTEEDFIKAETLLKERIK